MHTHMHTNKAILEVKNYRQPYPDYSGVLGARYPLSISFLCPHHDRLRSSTTEDEIISALFIHTLLVYSTVELNLQVSCA